MSRNYSESKREYALENVWLLCIHRFNIHDFDYSKVIAKGIYTYINIYIHTFVYMNHYAIHQK